MSRPARRVLITGASAGIGRALAMVLADRGDRLALVARRADRLEAIVDGLRARGVGAHAIPADLAEDDGPRRAVEAAVARLGGLDVAVNNAGIGLPRFFGESDPSAIAEQIAVNFRAPILVARHALPHLLASKGILINVGSAVTTLANPALGVYGATKAGLANFNDALRREVRHRGVRVCLVEPGPVETEFFDAVTARATDDRKVLGASPPTDRLYNPVRDRPPKLWAITESDAARRIARLIDRPRPLLAFPRRMVWPWRIFGGFLRAAPAVSDRAISAMVVRIEREEARRRSVVGSDPPRDVTLPRDGPAEG